MGAAVWSAPVVPIWIQIIAHVPTAVAPRAATTAHAAIPAFSQQVALCAVHASEKVACVDRAIPPRARRVRNRREARRRPRRRRRRRRRRRSARRGADARRNVRRRRWARAVAAEGAAVASTAVVQTVEARRRVAHRQARRAPRDSAAAQAAVMPFVEGVAVGAVEAAEVVVPARRPFQPRAVARGTEQRRTARQRCEQAGEGSFRCGVHRE